jgi:hypothetical protein
MRKGAVFLNRNTAKQGSGQEVIIGSENRPGDFRPQDRHVTVLRPRIDVRLDPNLLHFLMIRIECCIKLGRL